MCCCCCCSAGCRWEASLAIWPRLPQVFGSGFEAFPTSLSLSLSQFGTSWSAEREWNPMDSGVLLLPFSMSLTKRSQPRRHTHSHTQTIFPTSEKKRQGRGAMVTVLAVRSAGQMTVGGKSRDEGLGRIYMTSQSRSDRSLLTRIPIELLN